MIFYLGTHVLAHACRFERTFISVNRLPKYSSDVFRPNCWIMDSGAFTEISTFGHYRFSVREYAKRINHWRKYGKLECAVSQDYMCEPQILAKTKLTVADHQRLTIDRYDELIALTSVPILPVLQGYKAEEYLNHLRSYGARLKPNMRVGVGSVCKRNSNPRGVIQVLKAIKDNRPDLRLHGFGLKTTALQDCYVNSMLYSADSMSWSFAARRQNRDRNGLGEAYDFLAKISGSNGARPSQLELV